MPYEIEGPDGKIHNFPDGTSSEQINSQMSSLYGKGSFSTPLDPITPAKPAHAPLAPGAMPPGTVAGTMQAQPYTPDASMIPLSAEAVRAQRMATFSGLMGDAAGVRAAHENLNSDPTYKARQAQATKMGENAAQLSAKQQAGVRVYDAVNELEQKVKAWKDHAPAAFKGGLGPWNSDQTFQNYTGFMNRGAQAFTTSMHHDIEKLVALYREMPSTGSSGGSDAQDANFKDAMGKWIESPDPDTALAILQSAKGLVRNKSGLPHDFDVPRRPLDPTDIAAINHYAQVPITPDSPYATGVATAPPIQVKTLDEAMKLPPGTKFIDPRGREKVRP